MQHPLDAVENGLIETVGRLSPGQLSERQPGRWTIAEIVEHLGRAFSGTARGAERALAEGRPLAGKPSLKNRIAVLLVVEIGYFPSGVKSPRVAEPLGTDPAVVLEDTLRHLRAMDEALARSEAQFGRTIGFLDHPIMGPLSIRQWRRFHWIHTRHHLRQIETRSRPRGTPA